jgi:hypothetical protein
MADAPFSRRETLQAAASVTAGIALAGCLDGLPFFGGGSEPPPVEPVPADASVFATSDVTTVLERDPLRELVDDAIPLTDVDGLSELVRSEVGIDPRQLDKAVGFAAPTADSSGPSGITFDAEPTTDELVRAIEEQGYTLTETTIEGRQAYEIDGIEALLGTLPDGQHVIGFGGGTRAAIDTATGANAGVRSEVRRAYGRVPSGPVRFAIDVATLDESIVEPITEQLPRFSTDVIEGVRFVAGSLYAADSQPGVELQVTAGDETVATQIEQFLEAMPTLLGEWSDEQAGTALEEMTISRERERVTARLEGTVGELQPFIDLLAQRALRAVANSGTSVRALE